MDNTKNNTTPPDQIKLKTEYEKYLDVRHSIINDLKEQLETVLSVVDSNPVVSGRIKNFNSYFTKYLRLSKDTKEKPVINDLMGIRIICPFIEDIDATERVINNTFNVIEREKKGHSSFKEFGYESIHLLIKIPKQVIDKSGYPGTNIAEIQICTILQDAWAEVEHELFYKVEFSPFDNPMKRKLAAVNASLSLADIVFQEIRTHQRMYSQEMGKRRESFYQKIEELTDDLLFAGEQEKKTLPVHSGTSVLKNDNSQSIDDLLVNALTAHNQNRFSEAISQYTKILELKPVKAICSIIYKHRGMAYFACSEYDNAIDDFSCALEHDANSYKAVYYRGVVRSVKQSYSQAIDDYTLSLKINPYQSFCLFRRAQSYYHIGDFPAALADCENSLALEPGNGAAVKFKELLLGKLKM